MDEEEDTPPTQQELLPSGFHLQHTIPNTTWEIIQHWLSTNKLPSSSADRKNLTYVPIPWESGPQMQGRKIAQFGNCRYDYIADTAVLCAMNNPIPSFIRDSLLGNENDQDYTQCIINVYDADNEIPWHLDHTYFGDKVLVYTFGEERPLLLRKPISHRENKSIDYGPIGLKQPEDDYSFHIIRTYPRHCSKYILEGAARNEWEHSVPSGSDKRVSITFRTWRGAK